MVLVIATLLLAAGFASDAGAACGCDKPPPPRAVIRPFVGHVDQEITLFDDRLAPKKRYTVQFRSRDGVTDWSTGQGTVARDFADGQPRRQLRVPVGNVSLGPCEITVYDSRRRPVYALSDDQFTVTSSPIVLHDFSTTTVRERYQAGVGADGTIYIPIDTEQVSDATTYTGFALGYPLNFGSENVAIFNAQGFLMGLLDSKSPGLFRIVPGDGAASTALTYWRHEFRTYKAEHRKRDERRSKDGQWHIDGTPHVDNYHMVVAISGSLLDGTQPTPGPTPPFRFVVTSEPSEVSPVR